MVAIEPKTGAILAMVSHPHATTPNLAGQPQQGRGQQGLQQAGKDDGPADAQPGHRAQTYPPGSTFKVVTAAGGAGERRHLGPETPGGRSDATARCPAPPPTCPTTAARRAAAGRVTLSYALEKSCNTPFGQIGMELGYDAHARAGREVRHRRDPLEIPMPRRGQPIGPSDRTRPQLAQASIGQRDDRVTPLQMAHGRRGHRQRRRADEALPGEQDRGLRGRSRSTSADPEELSRRRSARTARASSREMMVNVVENGTGQRRRRSRASRWPARPAPPSRASGQRPARLVRLLRAGRHDPKVARGRDRRVGGAKQAEISGNGLAAPIARDVMKAVLGHE